MDCIGYSNRWSITICAWRKR